MGKPEEGFYRGKSCSRRDERAEDEVLKCTLILLQQTVFSSQKTTIFAFSHLCYDNLRF